MSSVIGDCSPAEIDSLTTATGTGCVVAIEATAAATIAEELVESPAAGERPSSPGSEVFILECWDSADPFLGLVEEVILCIFLI